MFQFSRASGERRVRRRLEVEQEARLLAPGAAGRRAAWRRRSGRPAPVRVRRSRRQASVCSASASRSSRASERASVLQQRNHLLRAPCVEQEVGVRGEQEGLSLTPSPSAVRKCRSARSGCGRARRESRRVGGASRGDRGRCARTALAGLALAAAARTRFGCLAGEGVARRPCSHRRRGGSPRARTSFAALAARRCSRPAGVDHRPRRTRPWHRLRPG